MNMEQRFSELEITELEEVFSKSFKSKNPIMQFIVKWEKQWKYACFTIAGILLVCNIVPYVGEKEFFTRILSSVVIFIVMLLWIVGWDKMGKNLAAKTRKKISEPFEVVWKDSVLLYKNVNVPYNHIKNVVEYKNFLFISGDQRTFVIKADEEEKKAIQLKLKDYMEIRFIKKESPFDLREFQ